MIYIYYLSSILFMYFSMIMFILSLYFMIYKLNYFFEWNWFMINSNNYSMYLNIDWMTLLFLFTVFIISSMIMLYSTEYMNHDNNNIRFFWMLLLFIISMMFMILSPNILSILIGWDGLGLTSYCLIIYYQSNSSYTSGMLTVLLNRIGDIFIIMSISLMMNMSSFNFMNYNYYNNLIIMFFIIAAFTKSAQFPFSSWLPAAMAAPTPVSSLVHSSTLVTAGIYLLIRFNNIIKLNNNFNMMIMLFGLTTMMMAGLSANFEFDLKKIIAYSTLSQLGLMMMMISLCLINMVFFHLIIHAMFKSMMFMCSGIIIHTTNNNQDIRNLGFLKNLMPLTISMMMISNFSLCGLPFFSGFYSKDMLLEHFMCNFNFFLIYIIMMISTMLTIMYSFRLFYYLIYKNFNFLPMFKIKEFKIMNLSMLILMIKSIMFGQMMNWMLFNNIEMIFLLNMEKMLIMIICFLGSLIMLKMFYLFKMINKIYFLKYFLGKMWFLNQFNYIMNIKFLIFGKFFSLIFDKGWNEEFFKINMNNMIYYMNLFNMIMMNYLMNLILMLSVISLIMFIIM